MEQLVSGVSEAIRPFAAVFIHYLPTLRLFFCIVGLWKVAKLADSFFSVVSQTLLSRGPRLSPYKAPKKEPAANWAIVTGSTAGIGEQFAHQIAASGFNVALVSRNLSKLEKVASNIKAKYPKVETAVFALDAATASAKNYADLKAFAEKLGNVSILVNNLGISHEYPTPFTEVPEAALHEIIQVNCVATLEITKAVLPSLQNYTQSARKSRGLILTMGSMAGLTPTPLLSVYTGSKMFLQGWSSALAEELKSSNIDVQLIISYLVTSQMSKIRKSSLMCPDPATFVKSTLSSIGTRGGAQERANTLTPYWAHALFHWVIENSVGVYSALVAKINLNMHLKIRGRALKKLQKSQ